MRSMEIYWIVKIAQAILNTAAVRGQKMRSGTSSFGQTRKPESTLTCMPGKGSSSNAPCEKMRQQRKSETQNS